MLKPAFFAAAIALVSVPALADGPIAVTLKDHKFSPATIHVKAGVPNVIVLTNNDDTAEEFDSTALKVEKVVAGHGAEGYRANVRTFIKRIRKKFRDGDPSFDHIENYAGFGYRWTA